MGCVGPNDTIRLSGRTGTVEIVGSFARGARRLVWPARKFQESEVMYSSFGSSSSTDAELSDNIAVRATRGFAILVRPCSFKISLFEFEGSCTYWNIHVPCYKPLSFNLFFYLL